MKTALCSTIDCCRISNEPDLIDFIDLGDQPLANSLLKTADEREEIFPLRLAFGQSSTLVQLRETVSKENLFKDYVWVTGTAQATRDYAKVFYERIQKHCALKEGQLVMEVASNDGTFLKHFAQNGCKILGIDPAENIVQIANDANVNTWAEFWDESVAEKAIREYSHADVIYARNVIPHVEDLHSVIKGIALVLKESGTGIIEFHDAGIIHRELHYDSIYHEHLGSYIHLYSAPNFI